MEFCAATSASSKCFANLTSVSTVVSVLILTTAASGKGDNRCHVQEGFTIWPEECRTLGNSTSPDGIIYVEMRDLSQRSVTLTLKLDQKFKNRIFNFSRIELKLEDGCNCDCHCRSQCRPILDRPKVYPTGNIIAQRQEPDSQNPEPSCFQYVTFNPDLSSCCILFPGRSEGHNISTLSPPPHQMNVTLRASIHWAWFLIGVAIFIFLVVVLGVIYKRFATHTTHASGIQELMRDDSKLYRSAVELLENILKQKCKNVYNIQRDACRSEICDHTWPTWLFNVLHECDKVIVMVCQNALNLQQPSTTDCDPFSAVKNCFFLELHSLTLFQPKFVYVSLENLFLLFPECSLPTSRLFLLPTKLRDFLDHLEFNLDEESFEELKNNFHRIIPL